MLRFGKRLHHWLLLVTLISVTLAWPLHEASHRHHAASAGSLLSGSGALTSGNARHSNSSSIVSSVVSSVSTDGSITADVAHASDTSDSNSSESPCSWCMFHAQHQAPGGSPSVLRFHAEASTPPLAVRDGEPTGHSPIAAAPRGPPQA